MPKRTNNNKKKTRTRRPRDEAKAIMSDVTRGPAVPRADFLLHHVAGVSQAIRRTLSWGAMNNSVLIAIGSYVETTAIILNSPFDPDTALGGLSATGFAKYMALYSKCYVLGATIRAECINQQIAAAQYDAVTFGVSITTNSTSLLNVVSATSVGLCNYKSVQGAPDTVTLRNGVDIGKFLNKPQVLDDPQLFCTSAANPGQIVVAHCWVQNHGTAVATRVSQYTEVEYDCVFTDPIPFA